MRYQSISNILEELYERRVELAASKFSGVHRDGIFYRVHKANIVPAIFYDDEKISKDIASTVDIVYHQEMKFNTETSWLTMWDRK
jgi:hypothetical protein